MTTAIYIYVYIYLKRRLAAIKNDLATADPVVEIYDLPGNESSDTSRILQTTTFSVYADSKTPESPHFQHISSGTVTTVYGAGPACPASPAGTASTADRGRRDTHRLDLRRTRSAPNATADSNRIRQIKLRRILFLNGYPFLYIILWLPDIANRLAESLGYSALWLTALQATGQYIGLANSITYVYNEHWKKRGQN
jgi:hypothetical protein